MSGMPDVLQVLIMGALPISELRGAIPLGILKGMPVLKTFLLAVIGNMIPVVPLLLFLEPVSNRLQRFRLMARFLGWLYGRTKSRAELIQKYEAVGLALFVAVPLPATGAWSGCIAASIFRIKFRYALPAILCGVLLAGIIVTILTVGLKIGIQKVGTPPTF